MLLRSCTKGGEGVLAGAFQSEREEKTRDRAERGSAVRGFDQASVAPEQDIPRRPRAMNSDAAAHHDARPLKPPAFQCRDGALERGALIRAVGLGEQLLV